MASLIYAQLSPGELSKGHSHLEGLTNCTKCHELGHKVSNEKCLACHTELKERIDQKKGLHTSVFVKGKDCFQCHSDHHGLKFEIVRFKTDTFNHELTGYNLEGAHAKNQCTDCHKKAFISDPELAKKSFTYLGLQTECLACHDDYHQQTLTGNCTNCHSQNAFKPATKFNHQNTSFQLLGKHNQVACQKCHKITTEQGKKFQQFKGVKAGNCTDCHSDVHNNKLGQNCTDCHSYDSFKSTRIQNNFNHDQTNFKLEGKHQNVSCKQCHKQKFTQSFAHNQCVDCHSDYHNKQFVKNNTVPDCITCHSVQGFSPAFFTLEQHNQSSFVLSGSHMATPCFACHKKQDRWEFRNIGFTCDNCHEDIHQAYINPVYYPENNCRACHSTENWQAIQFDHQKTQFGLSGAHIMVSCRKCHFSINEIGETEQRFKGLRTQCSTCHHDIHHGQFNQGELAHCDRCHITQSFKPSSKFDHNKTQFVLDGKHVNLTCKQCHINITEDKESYVLYKIKDFKCEDCHR